jgi:hypothetical protein
MLDETKPPSARSETNLKLVSTTDPDAPCVSKRDRKAEPPARVTSITAWWMIVAG